MSNLGHAEFLKRWQLSGSLFHDKRIECNIVAQFRAYGYGHLWPDGRVSVDDRPESMTLYRGALPEHAKGMWWAPEVHTANRFTYDLADRLVDKPLSEVKKRTYRTTVPGAAILAVIHTAVKPLEVIVDPAMIGELDVAKIHRHDREFSSEFDVAEYECPECALPPTDDGERLIGYGPEVQTKIAEAAGLADDFSSLTRFLG